MNEPRRIYTRIVIDMTQDDLPTVERESYLYDGPMALCVDGRGDPNQNDGRGDSESGRGSDGRNGGSSGSNSGGSRSFGSADAAYSRNEAVAREAANRGGGVSLGAPSFGSADAAYSRSVHAADHDVSDTITELTGRPVTRTDAGYFDDTGTRMAYSSGSPTTHGAQATATEHNLGMSWNGGKAMNDAVSTAQQVARRNRAREVQANATAALKDPVALGLDPHQALAAYNDAMHGMYDKAVSVGAMTAEEARAVREAYGGVAGAFGIGLDDVTTPYESFVDSVAQGLVDPVTGKLTAKGWANVAAPALGMLAGPLSMLGFSAFGIPGAMVGALAPSAINAMAAPKKSTGIDTAAGLAGRVTGLDVSPVAAGMSYADTMNTMSRAQSYAGTQPESVSGIEGKRGGDGLGDSFLKGYEPFFTATAAPKQSGPAVNPRFQQRQAERRAGRVQPSSAVTKPGVIGPEFEASYQPFFRRA